jgi:hypothetical protein
MKETLDQVRKELQNEISGLVLGPYFGQEEKLDFNPLDLYTTGILYPQSSSNLPHDDLRDNIEAGPEEGVGIPDDNSDASATHNSDRLTRITQHEMTETDSIDSNHNDELRLSTNFNPSSAGISFLMKEGDIDVSVSFAKYSRISNHNEDTKKTAGYVRKPSIINFSLRIARRAGKSIIEYERHSYEEKLEIAAPDETGMQLSVYARPFNQLPEVLIVTVTLINQERYTSTFFRKSDVTKVVFQPEIRISTTALIPFPNNRSIESLSDEEKNLELLYRNYHKWALGHGISVDWDDNKNKVINVRTQVIPEHLVYGVDLDLEDTIDNKVLLMKNLAGNLLNDDYEEPVYFDRLSKFASEYGNWIGQQEILLQKLVVNEELRKIGHQNISSCKLLLARINKGVQILQHNENARRAFFDANKAMFMQRIMGDFSKWRIKNERHIPMKDGYSEDPLPDFKILPAHGDSDQGFSVFARWRPFQLAFLLSQIEGLVDPDSEDRDTTDLIWFPTGGGKTEAYLGLIAMTIFYRRITGENSPDDSAGVTVLMRYTLRMLNLDQYNRAGLLISACELIRRHNTEIYGEIPISVGIWVGGSLTPNRHDTENGFSNSMDTYINNIENDRNDHYRFAPPLFNCPCCGNKLVRSRNQDTNQLEGKWGYLRKLRINDYLAHKIHTVN